MAETCKECKPIWKPNYLIERDVVDSIQPCPLHAQAAEWRELAQELYILVVHPTELDGMSAWIKKRDELKKKARRLGLEVPHERP